jgi:hypothetical protein
MSIFCPYCSKEAAYTSSAQVYGGRDYGRIYLCSPCEAWVGVHKGTDKPLGRLADKELREWKKKAHAAFDPLWQAKLRNRRAERGPEYKQFWARGSGYKWLAEQLGISKTECHIGMFDVGMCKRVVEICQPYLKRNQEKYEN